MSVPIHSRLLKSEGALRDLRDHMREIADEAQAAVNSSVWHVDCPTCGRLADLVGDRPSIDVVCDTRDGSVAHDARWERLLELRRERLATLTARSY